MKNMVLILLVLLTFVLSKVNLKKKFLCYNLEKKLIAYFAVQRTKFRWRLEGVRRRLWRNDRGTLCPR